jgi:hypothetical protein
MYRTVLVSSGAGFRGVVRNMNVLEYSGMQFQVEINEREAVVTSLQHACKCLHSADTSTSYRNIRH